MKFAWILKTIKSSYLHYFIISLLSGSFYLLAYYPGIMSFDSVYQWSQISDNYFTNWHPAYHTIIMWGLSTIRHSPSSIAFFQIIIFSIAVSYGLNSLEKINMSNKLLLILSFLIPINIINGMMVITLWKDILYSISILFLTTIIFLIVLNDGEWITKTCNQIILIFVLTNIILLRHNGFPVAIGTVFVLWIVYRRYFKDFLFISLSSLVLVLFITGPIYNLFDVDREDKQSFGVVFVHPLAPHINSATSFSDEELQYVNKIFPINDGWPYSCHDATVLFYRGVNFSPVQENPFFAAKLLLKKTIENPSITIRHFLCLGSFSWQLKQPRNVYLETILFDNINVSDYPQWENYQEIVKLRPKIPILNEAITHIGQKLLQDNNKILWRPAIYLYFFLFSLFFSSYQSKNHKLLLLAIPILIQTFVIMFTAQLQALRYQYPVYITSMIYSLPLIIYGIRHSKYRGKKS